MLAFLRLIVLISLRSGRDLLRPSLFTRGSGSKRGVHGQAEAGDAACFFVGRCIAFFFLGKQQEKFWMHQDKTSQASLVGKKSFPLQKQAFGGSLFFTVWARFVLKYFFGISF